MPRPEDPVQWLIKKLLPRRIKSRVMNAWKFATTQYVVVSYPKSGRTWLRAALTFYFEGRYGLDSPPLLEFANLHYLDRRIPKIFFSHDDDPNARPEELSRDKSRYRKKSVLFLVRDPRDVCVSMYFHRRKREQDLDRPIFDFATGVDGGLRTVVEFLNLWAEALPGIPHSHLLSYEAMHSQPEQTLAEALRFLGEEPDPESVTKAIRRARFDELQAMERAGAFESGRLTARDPGDRDSFKVRRGKVGGYLDYFDEAQREKLDALVDASLSSVESPLWSRR